MIDYLSTNTSALIVTVFIVGLLIGSFLNVVIYRLPAMMHKAWAVEVAQFNSDVDLLDRLQREPTYNLVTPDSSCPQCGHKIRAWENIPLISWLMLRARCSACHKPISARYPAVELITALLSALVAWQFGWSLTSLCLIPLVWVLVTLTLIDVDTQLLPDSLTLPLLWAGLLLNSQEIIVSLNSAVIGAAAGYLSLWSIYWLFKLLTGKDGMGYGDFKLFAAFGAWFGWIALPLIILLSSLVGAVVGIVMILSLGRDRQVPIPFGPYLCGAALVYIFWGQSIMNWYLGYLV
ncbi:MULTISPECIES: A24 family peptidase [Reinekea]|jgi:leader peptidase (prepilin peptidase)/N-methyltransferase|uniref:Prepilin leader peptidase/N-methyltransferase n=1 Tax=Reinekea forsetii TaxID=1336806 RepID=A0A2K8KSU7_9GAMM|nr:MULTISPECIES: A24 family peptidase [Reinekea]ATX77783.1 leader peptidase (prepilin peptidase), A24A family [Reinekea forsetii]